MSDRDKILEWFAGTDTGASSKTLARETAGMPHTGSFGLSHPHDVGDLGRCVRLIDKVPAARKAVDALARKDKYWAALAPKWDELVALYRTEADSQTLPATYKAMKAILDPITRADPKVIVLGDGVTVRFGA